MPKVLFIATHRPDRSPSQRFRFEQYLDFLEENGWQYDFSYLISAKADKVFYKKGHFIQKIFIIINGFFKRLKDVNRASEYDIVFIQREAFITGTTYFEKKFAKTRAKLVFDFDDAIWLSNVSEANKKWNWLKNPSKTRKIITIADMVFAGNEYLANYAKETNNNVKIIPTTVDANRHVKKNTKNGDERICIGWTGSITTIQHFEYAIPFLTKIKRKYKDQIEIKVIGDSSYTNLELDIHGIAWSKDTEINELSSFDIGIMPLPNDEWSNGKCGLKGLQYMAIAIPTIMSPVGVNTEIISDGENGFLANSDDEWIIKIEALIESKELRSKLGEKGRDTIIKKYSVEANKMKYLTYFNELL